MNLKFEIEAEDGRARCGRVRMRRGEFHTPAFLPVATLGTVRALDS
ncbi:MAG: tRNA guanosine(34) transglycosylase Tgt, partial [Archaeoglobi archaeon]|nr:tRNA guanosine(34) transglycosylase Tgt [Candidatus Mnemosynella sp.]